MEPVNVRRADLADADLVIAILEAAAACHGRPQWPRTAVERGLHEDNTLLGYHHDQPVATATLQRSDTAIWGSVATPAAMYLHRLAASISGHGFGAAMLGACEEQARAAGADFLRLDCASESDGLRQYYCEHGYAQLREVEVHGWRLTLFEKRLRQARLSPSIQDEELEDALLQARGTRTGHAEADA